MTGFHGTFVISWAQTELDGLAAAPLSTLAVGATWTWGGDPVRVDGPGSILVLGPTEETSMLRAQAARAVRRLVGTALADAAADRQAVPGTAPDDPLLESGFVLTDGIRRYTATLIEVPGRRAPLLMFLGGMPPAGRDLWVIHVSAHMLAPDRTGDAVPAVICFTPATRIETPDGPRLVRDLQEGDRVLTKDDGPQTIRWIGRRRVSGARLVAMPDLRPIRIRNGAFGLDRPDGDLLVSPQHRMLIESPAAFDLFGTAEVMVEARDLIGDSAVTVDRGLREVTYVHLLLDRHQVLFANGLETESFHPGAIDLSDIDPAQRRGLLDRVPDLDVDADAYGGQVRRVLSRGEAALLSHGNRRARLTPSRAGI